MLKPLRSSIHGTGCFATRSIANGQLIARFEGLPTGEDGDHVLWVSDTEGLEVTNDLRFLNHARDPNAEVDAETLELRALQDIAVGDEVTIHYGDDWEEAGRPAP